MSALIVRVRTAPVPTLVAVAGEIDLLTALQFRDELGALPDGDVVLDLSGVRLLAAAGLSVLLDLQDRQARAGGAGGARRGATAGTARLSTAR